MRREHLDSDVTVEADVARAVHLAHAARAQGRQNLVRAEASADLQRQWLKLLDGIIAVALR
jgi:hypothetical protein